MKGELAKQIPSIKKKNINYSEYAKKSFQELFEPDVISNSIQRIATTQESCVAINKGNGQFQIIPLPKEVQFSSVNAIATIDINQDGILDLILGGNQYEFKPQFGRLDANLGSVLLGNKNGTYTWVPNNQSGIMIKGEVKGMKVIRSKNSPPAILAVINDNKPKIFQRND
jgi:hypothetical protein